MVRGLVISRDRGGGLLESSYVSSALPAEVMNCRICRRVLGRVNHQARDDPGVRLAAVAVSRRQRCRRLLVRHACQRVAYLLAAIVDVRRGSRIATRPRARSEGRASADARRTAAVEPTGRTRRSGRSRRLRVRATPRSTESTVARTHRSISALRCAGSVTGLQSGARNWISGPGPEPATCSSPTARPCSPAPPRPTDPGPVRSCDRGSPPRWMPQLDCSPCGRTGRPPTVAPSSHAGRRQGFIRLIVGTLRRQDRS